jgi:hypothetical protein
MKPVLQASGTKILNLAFYDLVSFFTCNFNLGRYTLVAHSCGTGLPAIAAVPGSSLSRWGLTHDAHRVMCIHLTPINEDLQC